MVLIFTDIFATIRFHAHWCVVQFIANVINFHQIKIRFVCCCYCCRQSSSTSHLTMKLRRSMNIRLKLRWWKIPIQCWTWGPWALPTAAAAKVCRPTHLLAQVFTSTLSISEEIIIQCIHSYPTSLTITITRFSRLPSFDKEKPKLNKPNKQISKLRPTIFPVNDFCCFLSMLMLLVLL